MDINERLRGDTIKFNYNKLMIRVINLATKAESHGNTMELNRLIILREKLSNRVFREGLR